MRPCQASVVRRAAFVPQSHSGKDLIAILETYLPKGLDAAQIEALVREHEEAQRAETRRP